MQISSQIDKYLHQKLPIDDNEKILAVYRHHWFAYVASWAVGVTAALLVMVIAVVLTMLGGVDSPLVQHRSEVLAGASVFAFVILFGAFIPVYLRAQERLVLTEEAVLQMLQPSLFASKIDQLGLQHIADVSVRQDFFGTIFGYGHITIETPGEQDNYEFTIVPSPQQTARAIVQAHENYTAALMGGRMPSSLGSQAPAIDPQQYQQFLAYQQMVAKQQNDQQTAQANDRTGNQLPRV